MDSVQRRFEGWRRRHPRTWASRHVVGALGEVAIAVFGIGLVVTFISLPDLSLPSLPDLPDLPFPNVSAPDIPELPAVVKDGLSALKYVVIVGIAVAVARREIRKRDEAGSE